MYISTSYGQAILVRSYTFHATLSQFWEVVVHSYTFLYVPCNPLTKSLQSCPETIRSYTFHATLSQILQIVIRSYTFRIRSIYVPPTKLNNFIKCYTFLYVPCNPPAILANCYTFSYVPITFRIRSALFFKELVKNIYVLIRSVQQYRKYATLTKKLSKDNYMFIYVPMRSVQQYRKYKTSFHLRRLIAQAHICQCPINCNSYCATFYAWGKILKTPLELTS